jgi:alkanesulfonate monooxygenase SsuD/methylene tetrahydromethanopterin reductase-like flavin-dependent oxidoreductase (luciferase family)
MTEWNRWPESKRPMGIGFMMPISDRSAFGGTPRFQDMLACAQTAEAAGYDSCWVPDHFIMKLESEGFVTRGVWEGWTTVAALAGATTSITLGVFVTATSFRHPGIIAKMAENLDEISNGRFVLGIGAGWHEPEYEMFQIPFDYRVSRFEDAITIVSDLLRTGASTHEGRFYSTRDAVNLPRGPRAVTGGPPILIGTKSPRMLRLAAQYADAWNTDWHHSASEIVGMIETLEQACRDVGRDPATMVKTSGSNIAMDGYLGVRPNPISGDADAIAGAIDEFRQLGLKHYVAGLDPCTPASIEQFARVIEILDRTGVQA